MSTSAVIGLGIGVASAIMIGIGGGLLIFGWKGQVNNNTLGVNLWQPRDGSFAETNQLGGDGKQKTSTRAQSDAPRVEKVGTAQKREVVSRCGLGAR